ncbi:MAG: aldolase/citrate lyase family protein [Clostridia bacterium]|jgi:4-hydroxy-2-oxoheptanedioate aldolase|nr:aldolase/citrate lyase family protein [Clostridia bacterium]
MLKADLKQKLKDGQVVCGTFFKLSCPALVEMIGYAGFDFIIVDNEHANFGYSEMENLIRAADGVNLHTIIRIPNGAEEHIAHALDSGASGVQIPGLTTVEQVKAAMPAAKYYPSGRRGMNFTQRAANYGYMDKNAYFKSANEDTLVVVHVENKEMVDQIEELCQVPEVDVLFAGPGDLSQSVGKPGQVNAPEVVALVEKIFTTAAKYKKAVGIWVGNEADAEKYIKMGAQYIGYMNDIAMVNSVLQESAKAFTRLRAGK